VEEKHVVQLYQLARHRPALDKPLHQRLRQEARERQERADAEARERQETAQADEDATVRSIVAMVGVSPEDDAEQRTHNLTAAEIRYIVRAAYRHGWASRG
jgi:hypothetical protein